MADNMTMADNIYWHMLEHGSINTREALELYNCINLKQMIEVLVKNGVEVDKKLVRVNCNNGMQTCVSEYSIKED